MLKLSKIIVKIRNFSDHVDYYNNVCVCVFQCQPTALLRASGSTQGG